MSVIATALKYLMAAGMTGDDLVHAVAELEADLAAMPAPVDRVAEKRRAWDRERKRIEAEAKRSGGIPVESAENAETGSLSRPPNEINSNPPTHTLPDKTPRASKPRRLSIDWEPLPLPAPLAAAVAAWPAGALEREMAKFRDWAASAPGKTGVKSDWDAAWRNWLRRRDEEGTHHGRSNQVIPIRRGAGDDRRNSLTRACDDALDHLG